MEYAVDIFESVPSYVNHYVGFIEHTCDTRCGNTCIKSLFSRNSLKCISFKITALLSGVGTDNRPIIVPDATISGILSEVYTNFRPINSAVTSVSYNDVIITETINIIVADVRNNLEIEEINSKLTIWTTVLGDFNEHGLRSHPIIKLREKRPMPMMFNMNY